jgi:hypothetical protein
VHGIHDFFMHSVQLTRTWSGNAIDLDYDTGAQGPTEFADQVAQVIARFFACE